MDSDVRMELDAIWVAIGGKPVIPPVTVPGNPDDMVQIVSNEWIENRCTPDSNPPLSDWLHRWQLEAIEDIARTLNIRLICPHANPYSGEEGAHKGNAADLIYFEVPKMVEFVPLMVEKFKNLTRSTIPNPTRRQIISAATLDSTGWNHDGHMHAELKQVMQNGQVLQLDQILMDPAIRAKILAAA
jgi:hypothetical protein